MENCMLLKNEELLIINGGEITSKTSFGYDVGYIVGTLLTKEFWVGWVMDTFH